MKLAAQLFTIRDFTKNETDIYASLKKVKRIGYNAIQISAFGPYRTEWMADVLREIGLEVCVTHMPLQRILQDTDALIAEHKEAPHLRVLQKRLAREVTVMVHSEEDYNAAVEASGILFGNATSDALKRLDEDTLLSVFEGVPQFEVAKSEIEAGIKAVAIFPSKGEMRKMTQGGGVSLNKEKLTAFDQVITADDLLDEKYLLVQRGKKNYYLIIAK